MLLRDAIFSNFTIYVTFLSKIEKEIGILKIVHIAADMQLYVKFFLTCCFVNPNFTVELQIFSYKDWCLKFFISLNKMLEGLPKNLCYAYFVPICCIFWHL